MKIEEVIKPNSPMSVQKRTILNLMYTQNVIADSFHEILKTYDLSAEQFNVLRI
jgi:hypothetical protein